MAVINSKFNKSKKKKEMKKIFYILASAIVALGAVACDNQDLDNVNPVSEGLTITASLDDATKVNLDGEFNASWEENDKVVVFYYDETLGKEYAFTFEQESAGVFKCNHEDVNVLVGKSCYAFCGEFDSTKGLKGVEFGANGEIKAEGTKLHFTPQNALLHVVADANTVLRSTDAIFGADGQTVEEVALAEGENYVACRNVQATISYSINGKEGKSLTKAFEAGVVYNLGTLANPAPVASEYGLVGSFQGWDVAAGKPVVMYVEGDWVVAKGVEFYKDDEFKIVKGNSWDVNFGLNEAGVLALDVNNTLVQGGQNMKPAKNGKFDVYFNATSKVAKYTCVEEYTNLTVNVTIENKAGWNPLYITLTNGTETIVSNAVVSNNVYAISGDYIGQSLSYVLTTADSSKKSEGSINVTHSGASILLEENEVVTTLVFELNTANAKQWWGATSKIHVWNTGTTFDTSWPGNTMTKTGDYTWSITVPSSLIGKTVNYLIHNGNGWQSKDSKITIKEGENKVTGSSIGVN